MGATKQLASRALFDELSESADLRQLTLQQGKQHCVLPERSELLPGSPLFPHQLLELKDRPKKLYALGNVKALNAPAVAIVGARKATSYGLECAQRFARKAAEKGITIVSGGAIGCDMAAHQGALEAGGQTIVVLGSGADVVYPLRARSLFKEVLAARGVLLSEAPWGSAPLAWAFSKRNRIIAALAKATLIVEAGLPSGTFQTADHTLALGNEVLVVPGPIYSKESRGSNRLLVQGALPIVDDESFDDALEHIFGSEYASLACVDLYAQAEHCSQEEVVSSLQPGAAPKHALGPQEIVLRQLTARILKDLSANPMTADALASALSKDVVEVIRVITKLEIDGQIIKLRDARYMTKPRRSI
ncbi:MAG: DNA-processing protein DprA [Coriobacteriia bacterium]|nr:DNA-processing protein DprA [Coriobacteriia bacterium]